MFSEELMIIAFNLNGIMLKKAESESNLSNFYFKLFDKIYNEDVSSEEELFTILGQMGG